MDQATNFGSQRMQPKNQPKNDRGRAPLRWGLALLTSALLVGLLLWWVEPARLWRTLQAGDATWLALGCLFFVASSLLRCARLFFLPFERRPAPGTLLMASAGHQFFNQLLPARSGELTFPWLLRRGHGTPVATSLVWLLALRLIEFGCLMPLYTVALGIWWLDRETPWLALVALALVGVALLVGVAPALRLGLALGRRLASALPERLGGKVTPTLEQATASVGALSTPRLLQLSAMTCLIWLCLFGMYYSCINAFAPCTLPQAIVASGGGILANLIPIGALGSLGTMEAGWTASAMAVGLDQGPALASGLAVHTTLVICAGLLTGLGYLGHRGRQRP